MGFTCCAVKQRSGSWLVPCPACPHLKAVLAAAATRASLLPALCLARTCAAAAVCGAEASPWGLGNEEGAQRVFRTSPRIPVQGVRDPTEVWVPLASPHAWHVPGFAKRGSACCQAAEQWDGSAGRSPSLLAAHPPLVLQRRNVALLRPWVSKSAWVAQGNKSSFLMPWKRAGGQGLGLL